MQTEPFADTTGRPGRTAWLDACLLAAVLILSTAISCRIATLHKFENDELLSAWTDSLPTARQLLDVQLHSPISLDPPVYHLLAHASIKLFGITQFADRFPSIIGFLLFQLALFALVRRIAGTRAGVIAATIPTLTATFLVEATDARPYALLLGLYATALLCWQLANSARTPNRRTIARIALAVTLTLTLFAHFFGVLILIPICVAETAQSFARRKLDWATASAIAFALLSAALLLPFNHAVAPYKAHYWSTSIHPSLISNSYLFTLIGFFPEGEHRYLAVLCTLAFAALVIAWSAHALHHRETIPAGLWAGVVAVSMLPFFGYILAGHITHTIEMRHMLPTLVALPIMLAVLLGPHLTRARFPTLKFVSLMAVLLTLLSLQGTARIKAVTNSVPTFIQWTHLRPALAATPEGHSHQPIYTVSVGLFLMTQWYQPDPNLRDRLTLVYDPVRERRWNHMDTLSITAMNLRHFSHFRIVSFDTVLTDQHPLFLSDHFGWDWIPAELKREGRQLQPLGEGLGGTVNILLPNASNASTSTAH
jgi:hypothetical protein